MANVKISDATVTIPAMTDLIPIARPGSTNAYAATIGSLGNAFAYGSFYDTTNQTAASTTATYIINIGSVFSASGVSRADGGQIVFGAAGTYNVQYSIQFINSNSSVQDADVWLKKNGVDVANSNSRWTIPNKHGSVNGAAIAAINFFVTVSANDYIQLQWAVSNTDVSIATLAAQTNPIVPVSPGVILTAQQIR